MKTTKILLLSALAVTLTLPAAGWQDEETEAEKAAAEVMATLTDMWDAIEKGAVGRYADYIHPDFTAFGESDVYLSAGKEREVRSITDYVRRAKNVHTEMHQPRVTVRGDTAWIVYYWTDSGTVDGERFTSRGKSTRIFVREDGRWLCIHGHYTAVP